MRKENIMGAIGFFAASGAESSLGAGVAKEQIWDLVAGGGVTVPSRIGFFGAAGHGASVLLNHYNNSAFVVDKNGDLWAASGQLVPMKYTGAATVLVSGCPAATGWGWSLNQAHRFPPESGSLLIRFTEPTGGAVQTLNATFRSVVLTAADATADITAGADSTEVEIQAFECSRHGFLTVGGRKPGMDGDSLSGYDGDVAWTQIDDSGSSNQLALWDHPWTSAIHDFAVGVSVKPTTTGGIKTFGFMVVLDYV